METTGQTTVPAPGEPPARALVTQQALRRIQDMLRDGAIAPGQPLPSQRELARMLDVSRASLREALSVLDTLGVVRIEPGRGTFVVGPDEAAEAVADGEGGRPSWRFAARYAPEEVYQFRYGLEAQAAALAALRIGDDEIAALRRNLDRFAAALRERDLVASAQLDFEFHRMIVAAAGNRLLRDLHHGHRSVLLESQRLPLARRSRIAEPVVEHERIVKALSMRDPDGASYYMRIHIGRAADRVGIAVVDVP